jgi:hypothetical protein
MHKHVIQNKLKPATIVKNDTQAEHDINCLKRVNEDISTPRANKSDR